MTRSDRRRPGRGAVALLFYALLAAFLLRYLRGVDWSGLRALDLRPGFLALALPLSLVPRALQPLAWRRLIRGYGQEPPPYPELTLVYAKSWMGRYIPGKVAALGSRLLFASRWGVPLEILALSSLVEAGLQLTTALGMAFLLFALSGGIDPLGPGLRWFSGGAFALATVLLLPPVFNRVVAAVRRSRPGDRAESDERPPGDLALRSFLGAALLYTVIHVLGGLPLYLVLEGIYAPLSPTEAPYLVAAFLLAGSLGTLAVFAPSGLGVREGALLVLLAAVMPREVTLVAVVVLRLWSIALDAAFLGAAALLARARG